MKLALVTHNFFCGDGQSRVNYELARYALQEGVEVSLLADRVDSKLQEMGGTWVPVTPGQQKTHLVKCWKFARQAHHVLRHIQSGQDIVHANGFTISGPHQVNTSHFVHGVWRRSPVHTAKLRRDLYGLYQWTYSALNASWEKKVYQQAQVVVSVSARVRDELIEIGIPAERIRVIVNGVDPDEFHPGKEDRTALGLPEGVPLALFVGDIRTPRKNLDTILAALKQVPSLHLAVAGDTQASPFPALARQLGIEDRVQFLGFRKDIKQLMRAADIFVFPSRYEACSLALLEAMASGLPILTAQTTGGAELVDAQCGIVLSDPNDVAQLAAALQRLADDPKSRACMGQAARNVAEQHSWTHMAQEYLQLYHNMGR